MASTKSTPEEMAAFKARWDAGESPQAIMRDRDTATLAALGIPVRVGSLGIVFSAETIARLGTIESPFVESGDGDQDITLQDVASAVYAMAGPVDALEPIMEERHRRAIIARHQASAISRGPEYYERWLRVESDLGLIRLRWEKDAAAFYASHCAGMDLQDVVDSLVSGLSDAFSWADAIADDAAKKGAAPMPADSMPNGSDEPSARWYRSAFRWLTRCLPRSRELAGSP